MIAFTAIWGRIENRAGEVFRQKRGGEFTYSIRGTVLIPDRTNRLLPQSHFEKAFRLVPLDGPSQVYRLQGPSYLYAILMDDRIRANDW